MSTDKGMMGSGEGATEKKEHSNIFEAQSKVGFYQLDFVSKFVMNKVKKNEKLVVFWIV